MNRFLSTNSLIIFVSIIAVCIFRFIPHPPNFSPIGAMALFGGAYLSGRLLMVFPLVVLFLSDLILNNVGYAEYNPTFTFFYGGAFWVYGSFSLMILIGYWMSKKISISTVVAGSLLSSVLFFALTNFGVWLGSRMYTLDFQGLITCYIAALPFFSNAVIGDLVFNGALFGGYYLYSRKLVTAK